MKLNLVQHEDDEAIDEVVVVVDNQPFIRCHMVPRYKTSGLSGDEWRVSVVWEKREGGLWVAFDGPYRNLETAAAAIFPGVCKSHREWHARTCTSVRLLRKGIPVIEMTDDGKPQPLIDAVGHLPWIMMIWNEQEHGLSAPYGGECTPDLCFQVGCSEKAVSTYLLKKRYRRDGSEYSASPEWDPERRDARRFCAKHLRRGDCGLDDADINYEIYEGPGPDNHRMDPSDESPSRFGGAVQL